jgi:hypothetical protein
MSKGKRILQTGAENKSGIISNRDADRSFLERANGNYLLAVALWIDDRKWNAAVKILLKGLLIVIMVGLVVCLLCWPVAIRFVK